MTRFHVDPPRAAEWPDTLPSHYRSEAFAEDLLEHVAPLPQWREGAPQGRVQRAGDGRKGAPEQDLRRRGSDGGALFAGLGWQGA